MTLAVAPSGQLWVKRRVPNSGERSVDVFSPDGEYRGDPATEMPFPTAFLPDGRAVVIERDNMDIERVVLYSVVFESGP